MSIPVTSLAQLIASYSAGESVYSAYEESKNNAASPPESRSSKQLVQAVANVALSAGALRAMSKTSPVSLALAAGIGLGYSIMKNNLIEGGKPTGVAQQMMDGSVAGSVTAVALKKVNIPRAVAVSFGFIAGGVVPPGLHYASSQASHFFNSIPIKPVNKE